MIRRTWRSGWSPSRKERSGTGVTQTLAAISLTAALALGLVGASPARAAAPQALTALTPSFVVAGSGTARVVVSPDGKSVYATNKSATDVSQYARNAVSGVLTALSPATVATGSEPEGVTVSPDGTSVYVANRFSNTISQYSRNTTTGNLTPLSPATIATGVGPTGIAISADGKSVYATDSISEDVAQYSRNTTTGKLVALSTGTVAAGANAHGILVSPDGKNVYETNYGAGTVSQYSRNAETGALTALGSATEAAGVNPHDLAISADGKNVYVANSGSPGYISQFNRDPTTGALTVMSTRVPAGEFTEGVVVSPDGNGVYATNEATGNISQYFRNTETGALTAQSPATVPVGSNPEGIAISADGKNVYAADGGSAGISQYARNPEPPQPPAVLTGSAGGVGQSSATLSGSVNPNGQLVTECRFEYGTTSGYGSIASCTSLPGFGSSPVAVSASVTGLTASTTYHFRVVATNANGISNGPDETFKTLSNGPTVVTKAASTVVQTSATLNATVNPNSNEVSECKVEYGTTEAYGSSVTCSPAPGAGTSPVAVSGSAVGLSANTTYHFRISATNAGGTSKGADETLKTLPNAPTVVTKAASVLTQTSATLNATVNPNGGEVSECKLEYGTTNAYGSSAPCASLPGSGTNAVAVSAAITGLTANTTYHFRSIATNAGGTSKGADETLRTLPNAPAIVTKTASAVTQTGATLNATVNPNGGEVGECRFEYGTTELYGSSASCSSPPGSGTSPVAVSASLGLLTLTENTTYHFRISASNAGGTSKGADETLKTPVSGPTVETKVASAVTQTTATLDATVNPNGGAASECKLEYGTTNAYGSSATCTPSPGSGTSPVAVSASVTGLTANTTYHFRISATNAGGTSKGSDETLTTLPNAPAVVTKAASAVTQTTATLNATVNPNGGEVSECRFEYGATNAYGSSATCASLPGSGTGPVAVSASLGLPSLSENTTYHFRIVATSAGGTSKGSDETLKTLPNPPTVVTKAASAVAQTTATVNATVNPNGGEISECKVEYGTTNAYGSSASCSSLPGSGSSPVAVSAPVGGLSPNTTYHFRISATSPGGTGKGADETLKTLPNAATVEAKTASSVTQTGATLNATVNPNAGEVGECKLEYGTTTAYESSATCTPSPGSGTSPVAVSASVTGLTANTTYHFRISATNAGGTSKGSDETLKTLPNAPAVETKAASTAAQTSATLTAAVNPDAGEVSECKLEYGTTNAYGSSATCTPSPGSGTSPVAVSASVTGLFANTTYHFRISATNAGGTSKGADETFKTLPNPPTVETRAASSVTQTTASLDASVNPNGGEVGECQLEYGATNAYGSTAPCASLPGSGTSPVALPAAVTGLTANTTYHFRISATNAGGTSKGSDETLTTLPNAPAVVTKAASSVTQTTAALSATVNPNGGEVNECRVDYGTTEAYGSSAPCSSLPGSGSTPVAVSASVGGLNPNTTYHFRVVATNAGGTSKGADETLKTLPDAPTVETKAASSVTQTTATLNATVNPNGGEVSECKLEYGTTNAYGSSSPCTASPGSGAAPVAVSASVSGLSANTTYHLRISATNAGGTSKGSDETLKTLPNAPAVVTKAPSAVTQTTATFNATVNPNGGEVGECRFEYGTTELYGSSVPCSSPPGSGPGPVAVSASVGLLTLTENTTYHFRISATNAGGTSQGADETLRTLPNAPTIEVKPASSVTQTTATLNGTVNPNGGDVGECRFEYGTTPAYGSSASCTPSPGSANSPVAVSASVGGLNPNTTYHFRVVATNPGGTGNGSDETLATLPNPPSVETNAASAITQTTASLNATVNPNGGEVSACKLEYGTTNAYGSSVPCASPSGSGTNPVAVSAAVTGLTANTTYHYRVVATNPGGTSKGSDETVRTLPTQPTVVTGVASSLTQTTASLNASVNPNGGEVGECKFEYGATNAYGSSAPCTSSPGSGNSAVAVSASASGLSPNTTYHFRIVAKNAGGTGNGSDATLETLPNAPAVVTQAASAVTRTSATLTATVNPNGGQVSDCHFEYGPTETYGSSAPCSSPPGSGATVVAVSASASGLTPNTTYHFRISATNTGGTNNGSDEILKTLPNTPTVLTGTASSLTQTAATLNATVNPNGGEVSDCHFEYGPTETYGTSVPCSPAPGSGPSPVAVSASISGLTVNSTYHFRIVATNPGGTGPGSDQTFKTLPNAPTAETKAASSVTQITASLNATINPNGGEVTECRFEYGTTTAYGSSAPCTSPPGSGVSAVAVSASITGLSANTAYHFRIVAKNAGGTSPGSDEALKTLPSPTVETKAASSVTQTTATFTATVNPNGGEVSECRFEYGSTDTYGTSVPCSPAPGSGTSPVPVSATVGGLSPNTTYHFRVVATNPGGTGKGSDETLATLPNPPTVVTEAASLVTQTTASLNATVNPNGGEVSECKLEFGTTEAYGSSVSCSSLPGTGASPVAVSASVGGLSPNTTYHFRIVATNPGGTSRGADRALATPAALAGGAVLPARESKAPAVPDAKLTSTSLTVSPSGIVSANVSCSTGESSCTGTVALQTLTAVSAGTPGHQSKQHKPAVLMLASGSFRVAGGKVETVTLHLSARARALFAQTHVLRVRATIAAHDPTGATHSANTIVTLRALKAARHH